MGGGYIQLVSYGAQDVYLTGNPQITFFKIVYRRHTNFAVESIKNIFNGTPALGSTFTSTISRNGDLIYRMYVQSDITISDSSGNGGWPGESMLKEVTLEIGGQAIDKHFSDWLHIWNQLTLTDTQKRLYNKMIGHAACVVDGTSGYSNTDMVSSSSYTVNVPLQFWFCRNAGLALPIIALQYHEVKVKILFAGTQANDGNSSVDSIANTNLYVDYIFLDKDERKRFSQTSHEYLIEQLQFTGAKAIAAGDTTSTIKLQYNHPVKELMWVVHQDRVAKTATAAVLRSRPTFGMYTDVSGSAVYDVASTYQDYDTFIRKGETNASSDTTNEKTIIRSSSTYTNSNLDIDSGVMIVPAGSVITDMGGVVTTVLVYDSAELQMTFGTAAGNDTYNGATTDADGVLGSNTGLAVGKGASIGIGSLNCRVPASFILTNNYIAADTEVHITLRCDTGTGFSSGAMTFWVKYRTGLNPNITYDTNLTSTCEEITYHPAKWPTEARAPLKEAQVLLNSAPRLSVRPGVYFSQTQVFESHTGIPDPGIYVFSFALKPEEHQPSGTCNFSRLDLAQLKLTLKGTTEGLHQNIARTVRVYAINYNILRIMSGMGGIAFNN